MSQHQQHSVINVFWTFLKLGLTSFGGPVAHLGYFRHHLVENKHWLSEAQYARLVALCQFLPGPVSSQVGFGLGMMRAGLVGGLAAWAGFTLPSAFGLILFASFLDQFTSPLAQGALQGLKLTAFVMVTHAVWGMMHQLAPDRQRATIAMGAFMTCVLIAGFTGQALALISGGIAGLVFCTSTVDKSNPLRSPITRKAGLVCIMMALSLFGIWPLLAVITGIELFGIIDIFYRVGGLVFGGGHVVLPLLEADLVGGEIIRKDVFLAGYGAAQAVPGPLFTFAAYLGTLADTTPNYVLAFTALLAIFLPGLLLLIGAWPFWAQLSQHKQAGTALMGINAAVVGILGAALYDPIFISTITSAPQLALGLVGLLLIMKWRLSPIFTLMFLVLNSTIIAAL